MCVCMCCCAIQCVHKSETIASCGVPGSVRSILSFHYATKFSFYFVGKRFSMKLLLCDIFSSRVASCQVELSIRYCLCLCAFTALVVVVVVLRANTGSTFFNFFFLPLLQQLGRNSLFVQRRLSGWD